MRRIFGRLCLLLLWLCLAAVPAGAAGVTRALLVGCDDFVTLSSTVQTARNSVMSMARVLSGGSLNTDVLITRSTGIASVDELA